jgi:hypothetical protein
MLVQILSDSSFLSFFLPDALVLYLSKGEKKTDTSEPRDEHEEKKKGAQHSSEVIFSKSQKVQTSQKKRVEEEKKAHLTNATSPFAAAASPSKRPFAEKSNSIAGKRTRRSPPAREKGDVSMLYVNERVAKAFPSQEDDTFEIYFGTIDGFVASSEDDHPLWHVQYDDDDEEEFDEYDVKKAIRLYLKEKSHDANPQTVTAVAAFASAPGSFSEETVATVATAATTATTAAVATTAVAVATTAAVAVAAVATTAAVATAAAGP